MLHRRLEDWITQAALPQPCSCSIGSSNSSYYLLTAVHLQALTARLVCVRRWTLQQMAYYGQH